MRKILVLLVSLFIMSTSFRSQTSLSNKTSVAHPRFKMNAKGEIIITASKNSSKNDFDFLEGAHYVLHKKLKTRLNNSKEWVEIRGTQELKKILDGIGNVDSYSMMDSDGKPVEGAALRLFNPESRLWTIYWADSRTGTLDLPVVGSFEDKIGYFFAKDKFNGKDILVQFKWDITDPDKPIWSQAFSPDNGRTWEWNWYMYFSHQEPMANNDLIGDSLPSTINKPAANQSIRVLELRNYVTKKGQRDNFIDYFEKNFTDSQSSMGGYIVGLFRVKGADDNFFWMRGYKSWDSRSTYLPAFYYGDYWKKRRNIANDMLVNNDNVYLLKPLKISNYIGDTVINSNEFGKPKGVVVVDYYVANTRLKELINFFGDRYVPFLRNNGVKDQTLWISELRENDFPVLPVFQDKNLLVAITIYKNENEYNEKMKLLNSENNMEVNTQLQEIVTTRNTIVLYPTKNSFKIK